MPSEPEQKLETGVTQPASDQAIDDETWLAQFHLDAQRIHSEDLNSEAETW